MDETGDLPLGRRLVRSWRTARPLTTWWFPAAVGLAAGLTCILTRLADYGATDWVFFWTAGHALATGHDPYAAVAALGTYPLYYPGPAVLVLAPFGMLSLTAGWVAFAVVSGVTFGIAAKRYGRGLPLACLSAAFLEAAASGQWTPLLVAGAVIPTLGGLLVTKPSLGLPLFAWRADRRAIWGGLALTALSLLLMPAWPRAWWHALHATNHVAPILRPWGAVLLLAALRWRTPEGRLLALLALVPQTTSLHGSLPLFLVPRNPREGYGLAVLSYVVMFIQHLIAPPGSGTNEAVLAARWPVILVGLWLPALWLVLRPSPPKHAA